MNSVFQQAAVFLTQTIFSLYCFIILLRLIMQYNRISFLDPIAQLTYKLTEPMIKFSRNLLPRTYLFDLPLLIFLFIVITLKILLMNWLTLYASINFFNILFLVLADSLRMVFSLYFYLILLFVILSWISPGGGHPILNTLAILTTPILKPIRNAMPMIGGFDLSPIVAIIVLKLAEIIFVGALTNIAVSF